MAKDIEEILEEIKLDENKNLSQLNEVQQFLYYHHKQVETETKLKKLGLKFKKD